MGSVVTKESSGGGLLFCGRHLNAANIEVLAGEFSEQGSLHPGCRFQAVVLQHIEPLNQIGVLLRQGKPNRIFLRRMNAPPQKIYNGKDNPLPSKKD